MSPMSSQSASVQDLSGRVESMNITSPDVAIYLCNVLKSRKSSALEDLRNGVSMDDVVNLPDSLATVILRRINDIDFHQASDELREIISKCYAHPPPSPAIPRVRNEVEQRVDALLNASNIIEFLNGYYNQDPPSDDERIRSNPEPRQAASKALRLDTAFRAPYVGNAVRNFLDALLHKLGYGNYDRTKFYGRTIPIANSSGTGKSKFVYELGTEELVASTCLRINDNPESGYPLRDRDAAIFFSECSSFEPEERCAAFYSAMCSVMADHIKIVLGDELSELASMQAEQKQARRKAVLDRIRADWDFGVNGAPSSRHKLFQSIVHRARDMLDIEEDTLRGLRSSSSFKGLYIQLVKQSRVRLATLLHKIGFSQFFFAFDECIYLNQIPGKDTAQKNMTLIALMRIIKAADDFEPEENGVIFWHLLLDTTSSVFELAPSGPNAPSARLVHAELEILPIWPYMSFDIRVPRPLDLLNHIKTVRHAMYIMFLKSYGRPLWYDLKDDDFPGVVSHKLFCGTFNPENRQHVLAAFSHRILLNLVNKSTNSNNLQVEAVQRHARILDSLHDGTVRTASPSEPFLSIVSAHNLTMKPDIYNTAVSTLVKEFIAHADIIDRGSIGELYSRLLLTFARDFATPRKSMYSFLERVPRDDGKEAELAVIPVTLWQMVQQMTGYGDDKESATLPQSKSRKATFDATIVSELRTWACDVHINFTHFIQSAEEISVISVDFLLNLWCRGAALQCTHGQPVIDGFIVGYKGDLDAPLDCDNFVIIPWQSKFKTQAASSAVVNSLVCPKIEYRNNKRVKPDKHLVLLMDLGTTSVHQSVGSPIKLTFGPAKRQRDATWFGYITDGDEASRFCLNIRGNDADSYPMLKRGRFFEPPLKDWMQIRDRQHEWADMWSDVIGPVKPSSYGLEPGNESL